MRFELRRRQAGALLDHDVTSDTGQVVAVFNNPTSRGPVAFESLADFERDWSRWGTVAWR